MAFLYDDNVIRSHWFPDRPIERGPCIVVSLRQYNSLRRKRNHKPMLETHEPPPKKNIDIRRYVKLSYHIIVRARR